MSLNLICVSYNFFDIVKMTYNISLLCAYRGRKSFCTTNINLIPGIAQRRHGGSLWRHWGSLWSHGGSLWNQETYPKELWCYSWSPLDLPWCFMDQPGNMKPHPHPNVGPPFYRYSFCVTETRHRTMEAHPGVIDAYQGIMGLHLCLFRLTLTCMLTLELWSSPLWCEGLPWWRGGSLRHHGDPT